MLVGVTIAVVYSFDTASNSEQDDQDARNSESVERNGEDEDRHTDTRPDEGLETDSDKNGQDVSELLDMDEFVLCLRDAGVVIYGSVTCPICTQLAQSFGGYDVIEPIYVECSQELGRCQSEMIGRGVPEIQIDGEFYRGSRDPVEIGRAVGCQLDV